MTQRVLTGITTTGTPHLGNYVGAIRPAIAASREPGVESFFFLADYHALIKCDEPARIERSRLEIAATWIAAGLDTERATFYRQSDIVEIPELTWLLTCVASKGLMNRAHAYKAAADANLAAGEDVDAGITMGLFSYPILMAADILMFNAHRVPVGRDQVQHIEMARDLAQRFNHLFGNGRELFVLPEANVDERVAMLPGLDGRKMSKSYDNTVPLFEGGAKGLRDALAKVVTDSRLPGEPKDADSSHLVSIFEAFADDAERAAFRTELANGMGWGDAKAHVVERIERDMGPLRARYADLMAHPERIEETLLEGARKARLVAAPFLAELRDAVGLRRMVAIAAKPGRIINAGPKLALPSFKQYREADGKFYFKFAAADGRVLLQSAAFDSGREAGQWVARLKNEGAVVIPDAPVAHGEGVSAQDVVDALAALAAQ
ncbi:MAG: tryptophan--tRNA ligase [Pseudomonadota bacterium]